MRSNGRAFQPIHLRANQPSRKGISRQANERIYEPTIPALEVPPSFGTPSCHGGALAETEASRDNERLAADYAVGARSLHGATLACS